MISVKFIMDKIWLSTCNKLNVSDDIATRWLSKLQSKMSTETTRFYHNWNELLERKAKFLSDINQYVIIAVYFQYYEFDVKRNCVEKNCETFLEFCKDAHIEDDKFITRILYLLGDGSVEGNEQYEEDMKTLQDLDLIILGFPSEEYKNYTKLLRKEFFHLDDTNYKQMRLKLLQTFLTIPTIYSTQKFQESYENIARTNIKNEIEELKI